MNNDIADLLAWVTTAIVTIGPLYIIMKLEDWFDERRRRKL